MVLVPVGHLDGSGTQDWDALRQQARQATLARLADLGITDLEQHVKATLARLADLGITDLEQHIKFEISYTAEDWQQMYNLAKGSGFGLSHNFWQVGYLRPQNRHARYRNLYFAGASTHPGTGLPIVLLSAKLTTERILKEQPLAQRHPASLSGKTAMEGAR
ncbi:MAG: hypothetical protein MUC51_20025 [Anaerolineae bacterium]|nr:hypothetical protein [Anaerolineae bacterium]